MPRARKAPLFELGGMWIAREGTSPFYHRFWTDKGSGRTRRQSLGTKDIEDAKRKLAEIVIAGAPKHKTTALSVVLLDYFERHTDGCASMAAARFGGAIILQHFGEGARVGDITEDRQKDFAKASAAIGHSCSYISRNLSVLAAALKFAGIKDVPVQYATETILHKWRVKTKPPRKPFVPTDDELARFLSLSLPEDFRRWLVISCLTGARPGAALQLTAAQRNRDVGLLDLNPDGRVQNKKFRPTVREPRALTAWLDHWESEDDEDGRRACLNSNLSVSPVDMGTVAHMEHVRSYCSYRSVESVQTTFERWRVKVQLHKLSAYSIRHKVVTVLRKAGVHSDMISAQMGHKAPGARVTAGYGEYAPDYLKPAADALDAWWIRLQEKVTGRSLFPPAVATDNVKELRRA